MASSVKSLEALINDLGRIERDFDKIIQQKRDDIVAMVFLAIGKRTAYDTGVSRDLVKTILSRLGRDDLGFQLDHVIWNFWKTVEARKKDNAAVIMLKSGGKYDIQIYDYGFTQQDEGYVSPLHPRTDPMVIPRHVDYGIDLLETGTDSDIEEAFAKLEDFICQALEGVI